MSHFSLRKKLWSWKNISLLLSVVFLIMWQKQQAILRNAVPWAACLSQLPDHVHIIVLLQTRNVFIQLHTKHQTFRLWLVALTKNWNKWQKANFIVVDFSHIEMVNRSGCVWSEGVRAHVLCIYLDTCKRRLFPEKKIVQFPVAQLLQNLYMS